MRPARWAFSAAVVLNLVVLFSPRAGGGDSFLGADLLVHMVIFGLVALTGRRAGFRAGPLAVVLVVHAGTSELVQHHWLPHRTGDPVDVVADITGVLVGLLAARLLARHATRRREARSAQAEGIR